MRLKTRTWIGASLVLVVVAALWWQFIRPRGADPSGAPAPFALHITNYVAPVAAVPAVVAAAEPDRGGMAGGPFAFIATNLASAARTNPFAYRLTNSALPFERLVRSEHAVLLRNALIDTTAGGPLKIPAHLRAAGDPGSYIVQARGPITDEFRRHLALAGAEIVSYVPNNAYLVRATAGAARALLASPLAQSVLPFEPYYKLDSRLLPLAVEQELLPHDLLNIVSFPRETARARAQLEKLGVTIVGEPEPTVFGDVLVGRVPAQRLADVARIPEVQIVGAHYEKQAGNDLTRQLTRVSKVTTNRPPLSHYGAPTTNDHLTGMGVLVAVADTGVDATHGDLVTRIAPGSLTTDTDGHGTHVIGTLMGDGMKSPIARSTPRGSVTNAIFSGMAPLAKAYVQDYRSGDTVLQTNTALQGALISNNSWGRPGDNDYDIFAANYDSAVRDSLPGVTGEQEVMYVFAAGNEGGGNGNGLGGIPGSIISPATAKNVITVGASDLPRYLTNETWICETTGSNTVCTTNRPWYGMTDTNNQIAPFSSRGNVGIGEEGLFGRFKPDVIAPGAMLVSCRSAQFTDPSAALESVLVYQYNGLHVGPNQTNLYALNIPRNAIRATIQTLTNAASTPPNFRLMIGADIDAIPGPAGGYGMNSLTLSKTTTPLLRRGTMFYTVFNPFESNTVNFDLVVTLTVTNNPGNYFQVLADLNNSIGPDYRFEAGTSMAAPAVSGQLALLQEFLTNNFMLRPSPALMKAMLINGARTLSANYSLQVNKTVNHQGWGIVNVSNTIPSGLSPTVATGPMRFYDQRTTNALATGGTETFTVAVPPAAKSFPLRVTLVWTDPPGNPITGIKLVNDLNLSVTADVTNATGLSTNATTNAATLLWVGNNFPAGSDFTDPFIVTNTDPNSVVTTNLAQAVELTRDFVNNVENVYIRPPLADTYTVTVKAHRVNVNAINSHSNSVVQDYALVIASGNVAPGTNVNLAVTGPVFTNDPGGRVSSLVTNRAASNGPVSASLLNQRVGANSPLIISTNGATNQWCFYTYRNVNNAAYTNVVILTFLPPNLSRSRYREADIDLYVARAVTPAENLVASNLFALDDTVIAQSKKSTGRGGTELVYFTDAKANEVFYIGVKSEDQQAANFALYAESRNGPFSDRDASNNIVVHGLTPAYIPDGTPDDPGGVNVPLFIVDPRDLSTIIQRVYVTNAIYHEEAGDLIGILSKDTNAVTLNNHRTWNGYDLSIYDDSQQGDLDLYIPTPIPPDGPGRLRDFVGEMAGPFWDFAISDNALFHTGYVDNVTLVIEPASTNTTGAGVVVDRRFCVGPGRWVFAPVNVGFDIFNMEICASDFQGLNPIDVFIRRGDFPDFMNFDHYFHADPPGRCFNIGLGDNPPLVPGRYYIGFYNSNVSETVCFHGRVTLSRQTIPSPYSRYYSKDTPMKLLDDAVTNSTIFVSSTGRIADLRVGLRVDHERASDLVFHLVSPDGRRLLLAENRGRTNLAGYGGGVLATNVLPLTTSGGPTVATNTIPNVPTAGTLLIDYDFMMIPDRMTIYYEGRLIFDSAPISGNGTFAVDYGPGTDTNIVIIMNEGNNSNTNTTWQYQATIITRYIYTTFTENTNLTVTPIKFGVPPYTNSPSPFAAVVLDDGFDYGVNGSAPFGFSGCCVSGWEVIAGDVDVLFNNGAAIERPVDSPPFALDLGGDGAGTIVTNVVLERGATYTFSFAYSSQVPGYMPHAEVELTGITNFLVTAVNGAGWDHTNIDFVAPGAATTVRFRSIEGGSGVYLDSVKIEKKTALGASLADAYFLPEEPLTPFFGLPAQGRWTLEVWDNRIGGAVTNTPELLSWKLEISYAQTNPPLIQLTNGSVVTTNVTGRGTVYFAVDLPANCSFGFVSNRLACLTPTLDGLKLTFNQYVLPTNGPNDVLLLDRVTDVNSPTNAVLTIGQPPLVSATRYYLAVANVNPAESNQFTLSINFLCVPPPMDLSNAVCQADQIDGYGFQVYQYLFSPDAVAGFFEVANSTGNLDLYVRHAFAPTIMRYDYFSATVASNELVTVGTNVSLYPVQINNPTPNRRWYLGVTNLESGPVNYCVRVTEVLSTDLFRLTVGTPENPRVVGSVSYYVVNITSNNCGMTSFTLFNQDMDLNFYVAYGRLPTAAVNDGSAFAPSNSPPVSISITTASQGDWFIAVVNANPAPATYGIQVTGGSCLITPPVIKAGASSYTTNGFRLQWDASPATQYQVQYTDTLAPMQWRPVGSVVTSGSGHFEFLDGTAPTNTATRQRFYRLQQVP